MYNNNIEKHTILLKGLGHYMVHFVTMILIPATILAWLLKKDIKKS